MRKSDLFDLVVRASAFSLSYGCSVKGNDIRYSMTQATVQPPYATSRIKQVSISQTGSQGQSYHCPVVREISWDPDSDAQVDFSRRIRGGILLRFDFGMIVVQPAEQPESLQPTAFTTDAIITSSVRSKIAAQPHLESQNFRLQTDDGVVKIYATEKSLDQAAAVINIALSVPDVRQIVYLLPGQKPYLTFFVTEGPSWL
jgi:BON domain